MSSTTPPRPRRARLNFTIFALAAIGAGWLGVLIDLGSGAELTTGVATSDSGGTAGLAVFIALPALVALVLYIASRDSAGPLGFTLRFRHPVGWFAGAAVLYPLVSAVAVGVGITTGLAVLLHSVSNAIVTPLLVNGHLTFTGHGDVLASPVPSSIVTMVLFTVVGVVLVRRRPPAQAPIAAAEPALATAPARV
ncbi:hypothetical protein F4553_000607 [Allocatelliglobosispora scoriae]|uniref:CPBP family intramembrane metalloprotease n=1 Tax=Allocatelliglobosispora scoriae TaxID=643052 RepID=A0A841BIS7_9ACTN|nr:hypothetical protein [Allocatelliglobosispora scoriae]MBB5867228.1 hypothetical protein [Allocatelliglobosispora scoriae]